MKKQDIHRTRDRLSKYNSPVDVDELWGNLEMEIEGYYPTKRNWRPILFFILFGLSIGLYFAYQMWLQDPVENQKVAITNHSSSTILQGQENLSNIENRVINKTISFDQTTESRKEKLKNQTTDINVKSTVNGHEIENRNLTNSKLIESEFKNKWIDAEKEIINRENLPKDKYRKYKEVVANEIDKLVEVVSRTGNISSTIMTNQSEKNEFAKVEKSPVSQPVNSHNEEVRLEHLANQIVSNILNENDRNLDLRMGEYLQKRSSRSLLSLNILQSIVLISNDQLALMDNQVNDFTIEGLESLQTSALIQKDMGHWNISTGLIFDFSNYKIEQSYYHSNVTTRDQQVLSLQVSLLDTTAILGQAEGLETTHTREVDFVSQQRVRIPLFLGYQHRCKSIRIGAKMGLAYQIALNQISPQLRNERGITLPSELDHFVQDSWSTQAIIHFDYMLSRSFYIGLHTSAISSSKRLFAENPVSTSNIGFGIQVGKVF